MTPKKLENMTLEEAIAEQQRLMAQREEATRPIIDKQLAVQEQIDYLQAREAAEAQVGSLSDGAREAWLEVLSTGGNN